MNIGVVTSFYNGYDRFLPEWALSICRQSIRPEQVVMVASGAMKDPGNLQTAMKLFERYQLRFTAYQLPNHKGMGNARNAAVRACGTEWVIYLDVDDILLPAGIEYVSRYEKDADVICTSLAVEGDRGRKQFCYKDSTTEKQLRGEHCSSSHSAFKKDFWKKSPFIETNDYIEQPFWLGLAQAGARFVGTVEPISLYRSRKSGHNMSMTKEQRKEAREQYARFVKEGVQSDKMLL